MKICSDNHEEIVYEGRDCPLCSAVEEINELEEQVGKEEEANETLRATIKKLEDEAASDYAGTPA